MEYKIVAQRFREIMNEKGLNAALLSKISGVGKSAISHYYNGTHVPHNKNAVKLAEVLDCDPVWLMGFDVPRNPVEKKQEAPLVLTDDEMALIKAYRSNDETYRKMCEMIIYTYTH